MAAEIAQAADVAALVVEKRRKRALLMQSCADAVENLCCKRQHDHEGEATRCCRNRWICLLLRSQYRPSTDGRNAQVLRLATLFIQNARSLTVQKVANCSEVWKFLHS